VDPQIVRDVGDRPVARQRQPHATRWISSSRYFFGRAMAAERLLPQGQNPRFEASAKHGPAQPGGLRQALRVRVTKRIGGAAGARATSVTTPSRSCACPCPHRATVGGRAVVGTGEIAGVRRDRCSHVPPDWEHTASHGEIRPRRASTTSPTSQWRRSFAQRSTRPSASGSGRDQRVRVDPGPRV
jgi:hypothetical protein